MILRVLIKEVGVFFDTRVGSSTCRPEFQFVALLLALCLRVPFIDVSSDHQAQK
jgi:hypothetical protein